MALKKDMKLPQIKEFLEEELKEQVFLEIAPILYRSKNRRLFWSYTSYTLFV